MMNPLGFCQNCPFSEVVNFWQKVRLTPWVFYKNWLFSDGVNFCLKSKVNPSGFL